MKQIPDGFLAEVQKYVTRVLSCSLLYGGRNDEELLFVSGAYQLWYLFSEWKEQDSAFPEDKALTLGGIACSCGHLGVNFQWQEENRLSVNMPNHRYIFSIGTDESKIAMTFSDSPLAWPCDYSSDMPHMSGRAFLRMMKEFDSVVDLLRPVVKDIEEKGGKGFKTGQTFKSTLVHVLDLPENLPVRFSIFETDKGLKVKCLVMYESVHSVTDIMATTMIFRYDDILENPEKYRNIIVYVHDHPERAGSYLCFSAKTYDGYRVDEIDRYEFM